MERIIEETCSVEYGNLMRKRLGLRRQEKTDQREIVQPLLDMMEGQRLDFHGTFRRLAFFHAGMMEEGNSERMEAYIKEILSGTPEPDRMDHGNATKEWLAWLDKYSARIESERQGQEWAGEVDFDSAHQDAARSANPRFVLRQWVLEELIKKVEGDHDSGKRIMAKVMQVHSYHQSVVDASSLSIYRWPASRSNRGERKVTTHQATNSRMRSEKRDVCVSWEIRGFWASNAVALVEVGQEMFIINQQLHGQGYSSCVFNRYNGFIAQHCGVDSA